MTTAVGGALFVLVGTLFVASITLGVGAVGAAIAALMLRRHGDRPANLCLLRTPRDQV